MTVSAYITIGWRPDTNILPIDVWAMPHRAVVDYPAIDGEFANGSLFVGSGRAPCTQPTCQEPHHELGFAIR
jgi:hypothetical protein